MRQPSSMIHAAFSERLLRLMSQRGFKNGPSNLAREFNKRFPDMQVSPQTCGQWMDGRNLPQARRLNALAELLGTTPAFPVYGEDNGAGHVKSLANACAESDEIALVMNFKKLDERGKHLARDMILSLVRLCANTS